MARPAVLPLAQQAHKRILLDVAPLREQFKPDRKGTRPFLVAFLALIHRATGEVYGAMTVRKLLQTYAPEFSPSTDTIQVELRALRQSLKGGQVCEQCAAYEARIQRLTQELEQVTKKLEQARRVDR